MSKNYRIHRIANDVVDRWSEDKYLGGLLVFLLVTVFVLYPLATLHLTVEVLLNITLSLISVTGVFAVTLRKDYRSLAVIVSVLALAIRMARLYTNSIWIESIDHVLSVLIAMILTLVILIRVLGKGQVNSHRIMGSVAVYIIIGLGWASSYQLVHLLFPTAFMQINQGTYGTGQDFIYYSFATLTTVGYGDIYANHPLAQSLSVMEGLVGQLFPVILIARLVSLHAATKQMED
ncbi:MAG: two pore domain potassium channel family protein [Flammeovirgaceae bacterium]|nr:two pore domain potassium channel family protein [Flammeovirgaceae bacterium]